MSSPDAVWLLGASLPQDSWSIASHQVLAADVLSPLSPAGGLTRQALKPALTSYPQQHSQPDMCYKRWAPLLDGVRHAFPAPALTTIPVSDTGDLRLYSHPLNMSGPIDLVVQTQTY